MLLFHRWWGWHSCLVDWQVASSIKWSTNGTSPCDGEDGWYDARLTTGSSRKGACVWSRKNLWAFWVRGSPLETGVPGQRRRGINRKGPIETPAAQWIPWLSTYTAPRWLPDLITDSAIVFGWRTKEIALPVKTPNIREGKEAQKWLWCFSVWIRRPGLCQPSQVGHSCDP